MVFPMVGEANESQSVTAKYVIHEMLGAGMELYPYLSVQKMNSLCSFAVHLPTSKDSPIVSTTRC